MSDLSLPSQNTSSFFPPILPDELLLSAVARFSFLSRTDTYTTNETLFGRRKVRFAYDLPIGVVSLARAIGGSDPAQLVREHTLYPFFVALLESEQREELMRAMLSDRKVHNKLFGRISQVPRPEFLRHCPACDRAHEANFGVRYWQRRHQLPTSLVCVEHRIPLRASSVATSSGVQRYELVSEPQVQGPPLLPEMGEPSLERFLHLASVGHDLLNWQGEARPEFEQSLRTMVLETGYRRGPADDDIENIRLADEFRRDSPDLIRLWPWLNKAIDTAGRLGWIRMHTTRDAPPSRVTFTYAVLRSYLQLKRSSFSFPSQTRDWTGIHVDLSAVERRRRMESLTEKELEKLVSTAIDQILLEQPPVRALPTEIFRRSPAIAHAWRIDLGGRFRSLLTDRAESLDSFHLRVIRYALTEASRSDQTLSDSALLHLVGKRTIEEVRALRAEAERPALAGDQDGSRQRTDRSRCLSVRTLFPQNRDC